MPKILFVDKNPGLCKRVIEAGICEVVCGDIFEQKGVLVTASNPWFSMWGWLDKAIADRYPEICNYKKYIGGWNERLQNIIFTITVDEHIKASEDLVREAINFAIHNAQDNETILLSWLGTWIWWLPEKTFVSILLDVLQPQWNDQSM